MLLVTRVLMITRAKRTDGRIVGRLVVARVELKDAAVVSALPLAHALHIGRIVFRARSHLAHTVPKSSLIALVLMIAVRAILRDNRTERIAVLFPRARA